MRVLLWLSLASAVATKALEPRVVGLGKLIVYDLHMIDYIELRLVVAVTCCSIVVLFEGLTFCFGAGKKFVRTVKTRENVGRIAERLSGGKYCKK